MRTTLQNRTARRPSPRLALLAAAAGLALAAAPAARAAIEDTYSPGAPPVSTGWFVSASEAAQRADREYVAGMRPHHAGALSMSREYLADPGRSSPLLQALSRAIMANQTFEIGMLDEVGRNLDLPPVRLPFGISLQPVATDGLTGAQRFFKEPIPGALGHATGPVGERDVLFAKAMIMHHEGALEMARGYHANRAARNGYLGLMNVDILTDQAQEIALMRRVIAAYPGDPDAVRVDPSMVHGMEGMRHGGHAGHGASAAPAGTAQPARAGETGGHPHRGGHAARGRHDGHAGYGQHGHEHQGDHAGHDQHGHAQHNGTRAGSAQTAAPRPAPAQPRTAPRSPRPAAQPSAGPAGQGQVHQHHHH